jgi:L-cystine uptake protein TcyP (sodium:dicarboxylate symporter family)
MKKWNWTIFVVILATSLLGSLMNHIFEKTSDALIFGLSMGLIFGLSMAFLTKEK